MALIRGGGGGGGRRPPPTPPVQPTFQAQQPSISAWGRAMRGPARGRGGQLARQRSLADQGVTINLPQQPQNWWDVPGANWWEQAGAMRGPTTPDVPGATPITPTPWGPTAQPRWEGAGAPTNWLNLRSQDWAAMPQQVRDYLDTWLRGQGWRPGMGGWGRYGASTWQRAAGAPAWAQPGQQLGQEAFAGIPENLKSWLWWLSSRKGWASGGRELERPATAGWGF